ncbi:hypothetical protein G9A89_020074 [Geosiphon pyriformis]|nr:hypothetical protein G9A89_020074 [Geosiphon pyriformis]
MDLKAAFSSDMSKKKVPKGTFYGLANGFFSQKKKIVLGNIKHSGNKKNISLIKLSSDSMYSDMASKSSCGKNNIVMKGVNNRSLLGSATTIPKAKKVNSSMVFGSPLGFPNYEMEEEVKLLPPPLSISLEKKWIDPKIVKTPVEISVRKLFALDINTKTQFIRNIFSTINDFGGATTSSKFEEIIRSTFTSESSIEMAISLAREKEIDVNSNIKRQGICSNWAVVIKKILMNMPKEMIVTTVSKFGVIKSIKIQLIGIDCFRALLFTLPMETTAYNLGILVKKAGGKTCVINYSLVTDNWVHCVVVGFNSDENLESAFHMEPIFGSVKLSWTRINLVCCEKCSCFRHFVLECDFSEVLITSFQKKSYKKFILKETRLQLARLYAKKCVLISHPAIFGGKSWAQIVLFNFSLDGSSFGSGSDFGFGSPFFGISSLGGESSFVSTNSSALNAWLASLECSLELLVDQVSGINMVLDSSVSISLSLSYAVFDASALGPSSLKILTAKGVEKVIDFIFVTHSLASIVANHKMGPVSKFFDTDHRAVSIMIGLNGFLNVHLNSVHNCSLGMFLGRMEAFNSAKCHGDLNSMWEILKVVVVVSAYEVFSKLWFFGSDVSVVKSLFNRKTAGFSGISNELWKHSDQQVLDELQDHKGALISYLAAGTFVDDTIWIENSMTAAQCILDIASNFFYLNDISINAEKTVAIPINHRVKAPCLMISAQSDVKFFVNLVLRKTVSDKQFLYLVSAVLQPIVGYRLQFNYASVNANLSRDFPNEAIFYPNLYGLKIFRQLQAKNSLANLVLFANSKGVLGRLFKHRAIDLQAISWMSWQSLSFLVVLSLDSVNFFLAGITNTLTLCKFSLGNILPYVFYAGSGISVADVLGLDQYMSVVGSLKKFDIIFANQLLDYYGTCFIWSSFCSGLVGSLVLVSNPASGGCLVSLSSISEYLLKNSGNVVVYTNDLVKSLGSISAHSSAAAYFPNIDNGMGVRMSGLFLSTLTELHVIALTLECVPVSSSVTLFTDSQASLDAFKDHSGVYGNKYVDLLANVATSSVIMLPVKTSCHFLFVEGKPVSENACYFVRCLFDAVSFVSWEAKCVDYAVKDMMCGVIDVQYTFSVWHSDG